MPVGIQGTGKPLFSIRLIGLSGFLKDENGMHTSAGSNSYAGQVRFYSKNQLKAVLANTQLQTGQFISLLLLTSM